MARLSRSRQLLVTAMMLGSVVALVLAGVLLVRGLETTPASHSAATPTIVASPLPSPPPSPSPSPTPSAAILPADASAPARTARAKGPAIVQIGTIEIPKIQLVHDVFEGIDLRVIDHGPGHWPGTPMPGQQGNVVFAGHRVTHTHPFLHIDELAPGDQVIFRTAAGTAVYEVTEHMIVYPKDLWITKPTSSSIVTFFGCHPPHSARQRYVVRAKLVSTAPPSA